MVGGKLGETLGVSNGVPVGSLEGVLLGSSLGLLEGSCDGAGDNLDVGDVEGSVDGSTEGLSLGLIDGFADGSWLGNAEGSCDGLGVGAGVLGEATGVGKKPLWLLVGVEGEADGETVGLLSFGGARRTIVPSFSPQGSTQGIEYS